ncbi:hypothetical protein SKB0092_00970 [Roseomonas mucosa]
MDLAPAPRPVQRQGTFRGVRGFQTLLPAVTDLLWQPAGKILRPRLRRATEPGGRMAAGAWQRRVLASRRALPARLGSAAWNASAFSTSTAR